MTAAFDHDPTTGDGHTPAEELGAATMAFVAFATTSELRQNQGAPWRLLAAPLGLLVVVAVVTGRAWPLAVLTVTTLAILVGDGLIRRRENA